MADSTLLSMRRANAMVATAFTLALLAVVVNLWVHSSTRRLLEGTLEAQTRTAERVSALERKVKSLEALIGRVTALETEVTALQEAQDQAVESGEAPVPEPPPEAAAITPTP